MRLELLHGGNVGQGSRLLHQLHQGDQGVRLTPAEGHVQLAHRLLRLARQPPGHVAGEIAQAHRGIGEGEELLWVVIDPRIAPEHHIVEVGRERLERELRALDVGAHAHNFVPGLCGCLGHMSNSPNLYSSASALCAVLPTALKWFARRSRSEHSSLCLSSRLFSINAWISCAKTWLWRRPRRSR